MGYVVFAQPTFSRNPAAAVSPAASACDCVVTLLPSCCILAAKCVDAVTLRLPHPPPIRPMSPTLGHSCTCTLTLQLRRQFIDAVAPIVAHPACQRAVAMCSRLVSASTPRPSSAHRHVQGQGQVVSPLHSASTPSTAHAFLSTLVLRELISCRPASFSRTQLHTRTYTFTPSCLPLCFES